MRLAPLVAFVPDIVNHLGQLHGNDTISGGAGNDLIVGDDMTLYSQVVDLTQTATVATGLQMAATLLAATWWFGALVSAIDEVQQENVEHPAWPNSSVVIDGTFTIGTDTIDGGDGNDVIAGDDLKVVAPDIRTNLGLSENVEQLVNALDTVSVGLVAVGRVLLANQHHLLDRITTIQAGHNTRLSVTFHIDNLMVGNDSIAGGAGNDLIVGDDYLVGTPSITIAAGGTPVFQNRDGSPADLLWPWPWLCPGCGPHNPWWGWPWFGAPGPNDWRWPAFGGPFGNVPNHDWAPGDNVTLASDTIDAGAGDDLVWGDNLALNATNEIIPLQRPSWSEADHDADAILAAIVFMTGHPHGGDDRGWWGDLPGSFDQQHDSHLVAGIDAISGGDGSDVLFGQSGADTILGGNGDDWLIGGGGQHPHQLLDGGTGSDRVVYGSDNSSDLRALVAQLFTVWSRQFAAYGSAPGLAFPSPWIANYGLSFSPGHGPEGDVDEFFVITPVAADSTRPSTPTINSAPSNTVTSPFAVSGVGAAGQLISLYDGATLLGTVVISATGNWTIQVGALAVGSHTITAVQTNRITGIASGPSRSVVVKVFNPTPAPRINATATNVPVTFTVSGTGVIGDTVYLYDGSTLIASAKITATGGAWSFTVTLAGGSHMLSATQVDPVSTLVSTSSPSIAVMVITVPSAPTLSVAAISAPAVTVSGTCVTGNRVALYDRTTLLNGALACTGGVWSWTGTLASGAHTLSATQTEPVLGLVSAASRSATVTVYPLPAAPTISGPALSGQRITVSGSCLSGNTVQLSDGASVVATAACSRGNTWSATLTLAPGAHLLAVAQIDGVSGLSSASTASISTTIVGPPAAPTISAPASSGPAVTVTGVGVTGATVSLSYGKGTATATVVGGVWSITLSLSAATYQLSAVQTDGYGQVSAASAVVTVSVHR